MDNRKLRLVGRRILHTVPVVVLATFVVFGLMHLVPGDPAVSLAGEYATPQRVEEIRQMYGFDQPFLAQYWTWLSNAVQGNLSRSLQSTSEVTTLIAQRLPNTLLVVVLAIFMSMLIGVPMGILAATRSGTRLDGAITSVSSLGVALPNFWLAMILVAVFALNLQWFPATGSQPLSKGVGAAISHAVLPAVAIAAGGIAEVTRQLRSALLEVLSSQYVRTLHAKGLSPLSILWKHGLKNVSVNLLTVLGLLVNRMLGATVVIEEEGGKKNKWQIVGEGESDTARGSISWKSPMARALLGKSVGAVVVVERPAGEVEIEILELWFAERRIG